MRITVAVFSLCHQLSVLTCTELPLTASRWYHFPAISTIIKILCDSAYVHGCSSKMCEGQRTSFRNQVFFSTMWVLNLDFQACQQLRNGVSIRLPGNQLSSTMAGTGQSRQCNICRGDRVVASQGRTQSNVQRAGDLCWSAHVESLGCSGPLRCLLPAVTGWQLSAQVHGAYQGSFILWHWVGCTFY